MSTKIDGRPHPPDAHFGLIHGKAGVLTLAEGRQTAFLGSVNESLTAWRLNYELLWEDEAAKRTIDAVPKRHPFQLRYHRVEKVDWEGCTRVLDSEERKRFLARGRGAVGTLEPGPRSGPWVKFPGGRDRRWVRLPRRIPAERPGPPAAGSRG